MSKARAKQTRYSVSRKGMGGRPRKKSDERTVTKTVSTWDSLWQAGVEKAEREETTISAAINGFLKRWTKR